MAKTPKSVELPPSPGKAGGLGEKIEATTQRAFGGLLNKARETLVEIIGMGFELLLEALEPALIDMYGGLLRMVSKRPETPAELKETIDIALSGKHQAGAGVLASLGMSAGTAVMGSVLNSLLAPVTYMVNREIEPARVDPTAAWAITWLFPEKGGVVYGHLRDRGWSEEMIAAYGEALRARLTPAELIMHKIRTGGDAVKTAQELTKFGYTINEGQQLQELARLIPGPADLVSMAVREAFTPEIIEKYRYAEGFPPEFGKWMKKQGDEDDWALKYWVAHWRMPGLAQALDAFYRLPDFGTDELDDYLRVADMAPAWRDYIMRTAHRPLARVDVRRMYGMGVLDYDEVREAYLHEGYSELNATRMADFTVRYEQGEEREATKTDILSGLSLGMLTPAEATTWLEGIDYSAEVAAYLVAREEQKIERKRVTAMVKHIEELYTHREISLAEASIRLATLVLDAGEIERYLEEWQIEREAKAKRPSRATLEKFFSQDTISEAEFTRGLEVLGYQDQYVGWYLTNIMMEKEEAARKAEEAARKEQEDIRKRRVKSDYQVAKAEIDVNITEIRTAIAETQTALAERRVRYTRDSRLAREAVTEAELEEQAKTDIDRTEGQIAELLAAIEFMRTQVEEFQTAIAGIELQLVMPTPEISAEQAAAATAQLNLQIEMAQDAIAQARAAVVQLREEIRQRKVQLRRDLEIARRIGTLAEIEAAFLEDQIRLTERLAALRANLGELREAKATLSVGYREALVPAGG